MKNIKLNSKKLFAILLSGFIIVTMPGCTTKKEKTLDYTSDNGYTVENSYESKENESQTMGNQISQENISNNVEPELLTSNDNAIISYFKDVKETVKDAINSETVDDIKDKLKGTFIVMVDFIFYDGEIKGIKFDDLTEGAKQNILQTASTIDNTIMKKFPNYKEEISSITATAYNKASQLIKSGANNIKEFSKEKLGEDNYNAIIEVKDELVDYTKDAFDIVGDVASTIWDKGTEKIKNWYEKFKNN